MDTDSAGADLTGGREACRGQAWARAYDLLTAADAERPLAAADVELLAEAADMLGRCDDAVALLRRAYTAYAEAGAVGPALRCAYWLCKALAWGGEFAQSGVWQARAGRLAATEPGCQECAYLLMLEAELHFRAGEHARMLEVTGRLAEGVGPGAEPDLVAGTAMTRGLALVANGRVADGLAELDEAMVAVADGALSARATGMIYCVVIGTCQDLQELRRAQEWSEALAGWCAAQPDFTGAYRGLCRVHRVALMQLGGEWPDAVREARLACAQLTAGYGEGVAGCAFYQLAELHRLRGEHTEAEGAYRDTVHHGWNAQPGPGPDWSFPTREEFADYLQAYAHWAELQVRTGVTVRRLSYDGSRYLLETDGDQRYEAENVVVAAGFDRLPRIPEYADALAPGITQLHAVDYRNPEQLGDGPVLVVGAGNSGADIGLELAKTHRVLLSGPHPGQLPWRIERWKARVLTPVLFFLFRHVLTVRTPMGRRLRPKVLAHSAPLIRVKSKDLAAAGVERVARTAGVRDGRPQLADGTAPDVANVVWCTGFRPDISWIDLPVFDADGEPAQRHGVVEAQPGLYFVGRLFQYAMASSMIHGVGRDAEHVVRHLAARPAPVRAADDVSRASLGGGRGGA